MVKLLRKKKRGLCGHAENAHGAEDYGAGESGVLWKEKALLGTSSPELLELVPLLQLPGRQMQPPLTVSCSPGEP